MLFKMYKHAIHELAHITRYHGPYSETSEWTFDFRIFCTSTVKVIEVVFVINGRIQSN